MTYVRRARMPGGQARVCHAPPVALFSVFQTLSLHSLLLSVYLWRGLYMYLVVVPTCLTTAESRMYPAQFIMTVF